MFQQKLKRAQAEKEAENKLLRESMEKAEQKLKQEKEEAEKIALEAAAEAEAEKRKVIETTEQLKGEAERKIRQA